MKKPLNIKIRFIIGLLLISGYCKSNDKCTITGKIVGRSSTSLLMLNALDNILFAKIHIPIKDNKFTYEFDANPKVAYWLIFEDDFSSPDGLFPIIIFPDKDTIELLLHDSRHIYQNKVKGGKLNQQLTYFAELSKSTYDPLMKPYNESLISLQKNDNYYSVSYKKLMEELNNATTQDEKIIVYKKMDDLGEDSYTKQVKEINLHLDSIHKAKINWSYHYYDQNPTLVSYYFLVRELINKDKNSDLEKIKRLIEELSIKNPKHPYNKIANDLIGSWEKITVGGSFIDFTLPDLNGNMVTLSKVIKGKYALIDLWASWCGPCIATSKSMIPVYEEFKNSGFAIVGVAGEYENTDRLKLALQREHFPWINLVELDNQNGIWNKYGVSSGGTFLVAPDGRILAKNSSADEIRKILTAKLNKPSPGKSI